ncbi:MAG: glycosyltransferase family 4 protein [Chryseobacterium sp.]|nr:glycosyltransferase family 4 protein [Candidatus Chryseobacterium enterohippi]
MKIGFYSSAPLEDKRNWSGTMFKMYEQIIAYGHEAIWIPTISYTPSEERTYEKLEKIFHRVFNRGYNKHLNIYKAKKAAKHLQHVLENLDIDVLFVPTKINDFAYLKTKTPIIYLNDANVAQLLNYYPYYSGFGALSKWETKYLEKKGLHNSSIAIFSSDWASHYAINQYAVDKEKVKTLKFGANIIVPEHLEFNKDKNEYVFLFLAVDWTRKRGQLAYESLKILRNKGLSVKMLIIGCNPPINEDWVTIIPFLNKNNPSEFKELQDYLQSSHFLFVPTVADCTPIAFCEAAGYGLPVISTDTGGVNAHVENNYNGLLLPQNALANDYAMAIEKLLQNPNLVQEMSHNARTKYEEELNWQQWGKEFNTILSHLKK